MDAARVLRTDADETVIDLPGSLAGWDGQAWLTDLEDRLAEVEVGGASKL